MEEKYRNFLAAQDAVTLSHEETHARMREEVSERHEAMRTAEANKKLTDAENEARALDEEYRRLCAEAEKTEREFSIILEKRNGAGEEETDALEEEYEDLLVEKEEAARALHDFETRKLGMHKN